MSTTKTCYIVGAGDFSEKQIDLIKDDLVIACDGGFNYLCAINIKPDLLVGDMDSIKDFPMAQKMLNNQIVKLNPIKDDTDMGVAIKLGIEKSYTNFVIYGGTGGRLEHSLANIQLLASLSQRKIKACLIDKNKIITAITDDKMLFSKEKKGYISLFSHTEKIEGVFERGLKYSLDNATLFNNFPLGVSNEFIGTESEIKVTKGTAILVFDR